MKTHEKYMRNAREAIRQLDNITSDLDSQTFELTQIKAGARQAEQAAAELNKLVGFMEARMDTE